MSAKPPTTADTKASNVSANPISDDARLPLVDVRNEQRRFTANDSKQSVAGLLQASSPLSRHPPPRKRLRDIDNEGETTIVNDKEPSLLPEKPNEVQDKPPPSKKTHRTSMTIAGPEVDLGLLFSELDSRSGLAPSLPTVSVPADAMTTRHDSRFDSTCSNDVSGSTFRPRLLMDAAMSTTTATTRINTGIADHFFAEGKDSMQALGDVLWMNPLISAQPHEFQGATNRRLPDSDVHAIFQSLYHGLPPPLHLPFQVVPVGPDGKRLSPPSYEFEDGLYILMKPQKKNTRPSEQPKVPLHLTDYVMIHEKPPASCPWSTSGPQLSRPTAIQQRYCYPKGDPEYSSRKGGALWTMYSPDGKENLEYRLLHVYFSAKRVSNKKAAANLKDVVQLPDRRPRSVPTLPVAAPEPTHHVDCSRQDSHAIHYRPSSVPTLPTTRSLGLTYKTTGSSPDLLNLTTGAVPTSVTGQSDLALFPGLVDACSTTLLCTTKSPDSVAAGEAQQNNSTDVKAIKKVGQALREDAVVLRGDHVAPVPAPSAMQMPPLSHAQRTQTQSNQEDAWAGYGWEDWGYGWTPLQPPAPHSQHTQLQLNEEAMWGYGWAPSQPPAHHSQQTQSQSNEEGAWSYGWAPSQPSNPSGPDKYLANQAALGHVPIASKEYDDAYKPADDEASDNKENESVSSNY